MGVAPDHPKIKSVSRAFEKIAAQPGFRFFGNVEIGRDLSHEELAVEVMPRQEDEFTCMSCFLVHHRSQLADEKRMICKDCA